jgi:hypothetical protein
MPPTADTRVVKIKEKAAPCFVDESVENAMEAVRCAE